MFTNLCPLVGVWQPLSALDLLSVNNLINYFGKSEETNNIEVPPHRSFACRSSISSKRLPQRVPFCQARRSISDEYLTNMCPPLLLIFR